MAIIALFAPHYGPVDPRVVDATEPGQASREHSVVRLRTSSSLLGYCFNHMLATALTEREKYGFTHLAMLHGDIVPLTAGWLDVLVSELDATGADFVSVVVPIKSQDGLTSTGVDSVPPNQWQPWKRFTMRELGGLPETFDAASAGFPGHTLLVNTGCWVAPLDRPWWTATHEDGSLKLCFSINDRILKREDGSLLVQVEPEDWRLSRLLAAEGAKVMATRKLPLSHLGNWEYRNTYPWGRLESEQGQEQTEWSGFTRQMSKAG